MANVAIPSKQWCHCPGLMAQVLQAETLFPVMATALFQAEPATLLHTQPLLNPYDDWAR